MLLVVEDEPGIADFLKRGLNRDGFDVKVESDGAAGLAAALDPKVELVVLDLMLPTLNGMAVLAAISEQRPGLPVIVLTSRAEIDDRVAGLDAGAVDYLTKPFALSELTARIRAQLRSAATLRGDTQLTLGPLKIDLVSREVGLDGHPVRLSTTEFELLSYLIRSRPRVVSREELLQAVWQIEHDPGTNVVEVYVGYLRRKLRQEGQPSLILTVRSVGYRFAAPSPPTPTPTAQTP